MTHEKPELLSNIHDFAALFYMYVIFRCKSSEGLESSTESDLRTQFAI